MKMKNVGVQQIQFVKDELPDGRTHISFVYPESWKEYQQKYQDQEETFLKAVDPIAYEVNQAIQNVTNGEDGIAEMSLKMADSTPVSIEVSGKYGTQIIQIPKKARKRSLFGRFDKFKKSDKM